MKHKKISQILLSILISLLFSVSIYFLFNKSIVISTLSFLLGTISFYIIDKKIKKMPYIFSFIFVMIYLIGYSLYYYLTIDYFFDSIKNAFIFITSIISFTIIFGNYLFFIMEKISKYNLFDKRKKSFSLLKTWIIILICWLPAYIGYFPGIYAYDIRMQSHELYFAKHFGYKYLSKYHPPLHTFIWGLCQDIARHLPVSSLTIYCAIQVLLVALVTAFIIKFLYKNNVKKWLIISAYLILVINPIMPIMALTTTKDVYFGMCLVMTILYFYDFLTNEKEYLDNPKKWIPLCIFITLSCLFRNNAIYAFLVVAIIILIIYRKNFKKVFIIFICPLLLFYIINGPVYTLMGLSEGNKREMLCVPIQQIGYVVSHHHKELERDILKDVDKYLDLNLISNKYNLRFADTIKTAFETENYKKDKKSFWGVWYRLLKRYPRDYINAFLETNIPYWFIGAKAIDPYAERVYIEDGIVYGNETKRYEVPDDEFVYVKMKPSKWNKAYKFYHNFASYNYISKMPVIKIFYSLAFPFVMMLFTIFMLIYNKRYKMILLVLIPFMYLMTFLLGPVSNGRYVYPIILLYPIFLLLMFKSKKRHN